MGAGPLARLGPSARTGQVDNPAIPAPFLNPVCAPYSPGSLARFAAIRPASSLLS
jgi:hypothetical protein